MIVAIKDFDNFKRDIYTDVDEVRIEYQENNGTNGSHWLHMVFNEKSYYYNFNKDHTMYVGYNPREEYIEVY